MAKDAEYMTAEKVHGRRLLSRVPGTFILTTFFWGGKAYRGITPSIIQAAEDVRQMMLCFDNAIVIGPGRSQTWGCNPKYDEYSQKIMQIFRRTS